MQIVGGVDAPTAAAWGSRRRDENAFSERRFDPQVAKVEDLRCLRRHLSLQWIRVNPIDPCSSVFHAMECDGSAKSASERIAYA
jgi:hypothetical protein